MSSRFAQYELLECGHLTHTLFRFLSMHTASALPDRPTTAVRVYLKRYFHPDARKGAWTPEEQMALAE